MSDDTFPSSLPNGFDLNGYLVAEVLGQGGFGITYKARDPRLDRLVVVKEYMPQSLVQRQSDQTLALKIGSPAESFRSGLESFLKEAQTLARFQHANIVPILDFFEANGTAYLVMPFIEGESLEDRLKRLPGGRMSEEEVEKWLRPLLDGLQALHAQGVLHRDLKPDNIIITHNGEPRLIDFGAARNALGHHGRSLSIVLTPGYAPPEQYSRLASNQGPWTDLYALGAVVYRALTGREPEDSTARQDSLVNGDPDPLESGLEQVDRLAGPALRAGLSACLRLARRERVQGVAELRLLLAGDNVAPPAALSAPGPAGQTETPEARPDQLVASPFDIRPEPPPANGGELRSPVAPLRSLRLTRMFGPVFRLSCPPQLKKRLPLFAVIFILASALLYPLYFQPGRHYRQALALDQAGRYDQALTMFLKAAEAGHGSAQKTLADYYAQGRDDLVPIDPALALHWLKEAASGGLPEAQAGLGDLYAFGRGGLEKNRAEAMVWYKRAAERGHAGAQNSLGNFYEAEGLFDQALVWHRQAAEQGLPEAQNSLSRHYFLGRGLERDYRRAFGWAQKAAAGGVPEAQYRLAHMLENGLGAVRDFSAALVWYAKAAEGGDRSAQYRLARRLAQDEALTRNWGEAFRWAREAARQGHVEAKFLLAELYYKGQGVGRSLESALHWYEQAAESGHLEAQRQLGDLYFIGMEVKGDPARAVAWYLQAAVQGDLDSQRQLVWAYVEGWPGVGQDLAEARRWAMAAAEGGQAEDQVALAELLALGQGGARDLAWAAELYQLAADQRHPQAQYQMGHMALAGFDRLVDPVEAARWIRLSAEQGFALAQETLGTLYLAGQGLPQDLSRGLYWLRQAAAQGLPSAQYLLGACYLQGIGVKPNLNEGLKWFRRAARSGHEQAQRDLREGGHSW